MCHHRICYRYSKPSYANLLRYCYNSRARGSATIREEENSKFINVLTVNSENGMIVLHDSVRRSEGDGPALRRRYPCCSTMRGAVRTVSALHAAVVSSSIPAISIVSAARIFPSTSLTAAFSTANNNNPQQPNRLLSVPDDKLRNSYCALRHGQSLANVAKIISSDPEIATVQHGLSDFGHEQARDAGKIFATNFPSDQYCGVAIFSSDFKRARETAEHVASACMEASIPLYKDGVVLQIRLRERNFGELNGGSDTRYQDVWDVDVADPTHNEFGVESVYSVVERTTGMVLDIDEELAAAAAAATVDAEGNDTKKWKCVLVAHGDVLQILQTGFRKMDGSLHRTLPHLETATVRDLELSDTGLCGYHAKAS